MNNRKTTGKRGNLENGKKFSSTNQPAKNGRPKKYTTTITEKTGYRLSEIQDCIKSMLRLTLPELKKIAESNETPALELLIARGINGDLQKKELRNLDSLLSRTYGRSKEHVEIESTIVDKTRQLTLDEKIKILAEKGIKLPE